MGLAVVSALTSAHAASSSKKPDPDCVYKHPPSRLFRDFTGACSRRDETKALSIINNGLDANETDEDGNTVLGWAARGGLPHAAKTLVEHGADVNAITDYHYTILRLAIGGKSAEVVSYLISKGVDVNKACDGIDYTPLMEAASFGVTDITNLLIAKGANVNARAKNGTDALSLAAENGRQEVIALLADHGANLNRLGSQGMTPLMWASLFGHLEAVKMLAQKGAKINLQSEPYRMAALSSASSPVDEKGSDHLGVVKYLLEHGANPSLSDKNGETALTIAAAYGRVEVMKALVAAGADIKSAEGEGAKACRESLQENRHSSLQTLLDLGANPNWKLDNDYPALIYAIEIRQDVKTVEMLVKAKADVNVTRKQVIIFSGPSIGTPMPHFYEYSALIAAVQRGSVPIVKILLQADANAAYKDSEGKTALDHAREGKNPEITQLLADR